MKQKIDAKEAKLSYFTQKTAETTTANHVMKRKRYKTQTINRQTGKIIELSSFAVKFKSLSDELLLDGRTDGRMASQTTAGVELIIRLFM